MQNLQRDSYGFLKNNGETLNNDFQNCTGKKTVHTVLMYSGFLAEPFSCGCFPEKALPMILNMTRRPESMEPNATAEQIYGISDGKRTTLASVRNMMGIWHTVSLLFVMPCLETALQDTRK